MGITEDRNTRQIYFCFVCHGPGTHGWTNDRRVCVGCRKVLLSWNCHGPSPMPQAATPPKPKRPKPSGVHRLNPGLSYSHEDAVKYRDLRTQFLQENMFCWVSLLVFKKLERSSVVHHRKGRGKFLNDASTFLATTREGDNWIHQNEKAARELGFIL